MATEEVRKEIVTALDLIVHLKRSPSGKRFVSGMAGDDGLDRARDHVDLRAAEAALQGGLAAVVCIGIRHANGQEKLAFRIAQIEHVATLGCPEVTLGLLVTDRANAERDVESAVGLAVHDEVQFAVRLVNDDLVYRREAARLQAAAEIPEVKVLETWVDGEQVFSRN